MPEANNIPQVTKDVGINANLRPNSIDVRGQQPDLFPTDAFLYDDPNRTDNPVLSMKPPWSIDVGEIKFSQLDADTQEMVEMASITSEDNQLSIQNNSGDISLQADTITLIARELNFNGEVINLTADQVNFTGGSELNLGDITEDTGTEVFIKGDLKIESDDASRFIHLGSVGIYAEDNASTPNILHDLPDKALLTDMQVMGHLYLQNGLVGIENNLFTSGNHVVAISDFGYGNIKGVYLRVGFFSQIGAFGNRKAYLWNNDLTDAVPIRYDVCYENNATAANQSKWIYEYVSVPVGPSLEIAYAQTPIPALDSTITIEQMGVYF